jgi:hypothetical protein
LLTICALISIGARRLCRPTTLAGPIALIDEVYQIRVYRCSLNIRSVFLGGNVARRQLGAAANVCLTIVDQNEI